MSIFPWASICDHRFVSVDSWLPVCGCFDLPSFSGFGQRRANSIQWQRTDSSDNHSATKDIEEKRKFSKDGQRRAKSVQQQRTEKSVERSESCIKCSVFRWASSYASNFPFSVERWFLNRVLHPPLSFPSCEDRSVLRRAFRPVSSAPSSVDQLRIKELQDSCVLCPRTTPYQPQRVNMHQRRTEKSRSHRRVPASSVPSTVFCNCVPLCISNSGQRHTSAEQIRPTQTSREKPAKATRIW